MVKVNESELSFQTLRLKKLIENTCGGNISKFARELGLTSGSKLNRVFHLDKRSGQYPNISSDLLLRIGERFGNETISWIIDGETKSVNNINISRVNGNNNVTNSENVATINNEYLEIIKRQQEQIDALVKIITTNAQSQ